MNPKTGQRLKADLDTLGQYQALLETLHQSEATQLTIPFYAFGSFSCGLLAHPP